MSLDAIKEKLGEKAVEILPEIEAYVNSVKENEAKIFAANKSKVNKEAEGLRTKLKRVLEVTGYKEGDVESYIEELASRNESSSTEKSTLEKRVDALTKAIETERKEKETLKTKSKQKTIYSTLKDAFKDVSGNEFVIKALIADNQVDIDETDNITFTFNGESYDFKSGVDRFLADNKGLVMSTSKSGADSTTRKDKNNAKTLTKEQWDNLTPADKMNKAKEGFSISN
jgi:hypothetical protein